MPTVHLLIKGKVQGVFYRNTAKETAETQGISGWVRNTEDGHVEIMASGSEAALQIYIAWCHAGPKLARVKEVMVTDMPDRSFEKFEVKREEK